MIQSLQYYFGSFEGAFGSLFSTFLECAAFDISTGFLVSAFGYNFSASFAKKKPSKSAFSSIDRVAVSTLRGFSLRGMFSYLMGWLVEHSFDILLAAFLSILLVLAFRYLFSAFLYRLEAPKKNLKNKLN
jgi:hypothetical protein